MFKTKLPQYTQKEVDGKLITEKKDIIVTIDTSIYSEERWENKFPKQSEKETLTAYVARLMKHKSESLAYVLSCLKALYCFMSSDDFPTFESFCQQFSISNQEQLNDVINRVRYVFDLALSSSTASPKNL